MGLGLRLVLGLGFSRYWLGDRGLWLGVGLGLALGLVLGLGLGLGYNV